MWKSSTQNPNIITVTIIMLLQLYRGILRTLNIHIQKILFRQFQAYSGTFSNIQPCSGILRDIVKAYSGIIEAYGAINRHSRNST